MATAKPRADLAAALRDNLADEGAFMADECTIYEAGVDIVSVPCIVLNPSDPYEAVVSFGAGGSGVVQVNMLAHLVAPRNEPEAALNWLEDARVAISRAVRGANPAWRWVTFGDFGGVVIGDVTYAGANMELVASYSERA